MTLIRVLEIENFRAIKQLRWLPGPGMNCLIGPGDSGKSTILDAIDLCLGARRSLTFTDADFHGIDFDKPIRISVTLGALDDPLKNIDAYGDFLVGFNAGTGIVEPEPGAGIETALTLQLTVQSDLEPEWSLVSPRAQAAGRYTQPQLGRSHPNFARPSGRNRRQPSHLAPWLRAEQAHGGQG
jgi:putative ATP-dependent endonuclease of the OLD family